MHGCLEQIRRTLRIPTGKAHNKGRRSAGAGLASRRWRSRSHRARVDKGHGMPEVTISLDGHDEELAVFGSRDQYLRQVRDALGVKVLARHGEVRVEGEP